jgi:hypothetical protein
MGWLIDLRLHPTNNLSSKRWIVMGVYNDAKGFKK